MSSVPNSHYLPYKLLILVMYGKYSFVKRTGNGWVVLKAGPMVRLLRTTHFRFTGHIAWLERYNFIQNVEKVDRGIITFQIVQPEVLWSEPDVK